VLTTEQARKHVVGALIASQQVLVGNFLPAGSLHLLLEIDEIVVVVLFVPQMFSESLRLAHFANSGFVDRP